MGSGRNTAQAPAQAAQAPASDPDADLAAKALKLLQDGAEAAGMKAHRAATMRDIAGKARWGLSSGQRGFLADLVAEAEAALGEPQGAAAPATFDPSDEYDTPF